MLPYPLSYPIPSYPILSYPIPVYPFLSHPILSYPAPSYPTLSYTTLPYSTLFYPILQNPLSFGCGFPIRNRIRVSKTKPHSKAKPNPNRFPNHLTRSFPIQLNKIFHKLPIDPQWGSYVMYSYVLLYIIV